MDFQSLLLKMLSETLAPKQVDAVSFLLWPGGRGGKPVRLTADEPVLRAHAANHAADGLSALGAVGGDATGRIAAVALLSVHIEETVADAGSSEVDSMQLTAGGLVVVRARTEA